MTFFDMYDGFICKIGYPLIAMCTAILVGWIWGKQNAIDAISNHGTIQSKISQVWYFLVKYVCPIFLFIIVLNGFGIIK